MKAIEAKVVVLGTQGNRDDFLYFSYRPNKMLRLKKSLFYVVSFRTHSKAVSLILRHSYYHQINALSFDKRPIVLTQITQEIRCRIVFDAS